MYNTIYGGAPHARRRSAQLTARPVCPARPPKCLVKTLTFRDSLITKIIFLYYASK